MFGTDLPVTTATILNKDFVNDYLDKIDGEDKQDRFFKRHAYDFLFEDCKIPKRYITFLKRSFEYELIKKDPFAPINLPHFIQKTDDFFRAV